MAAEFDLFADHCHEALLSKYRQGPQIQAQSLLQTEQSFVMERRWVQAIYGVHSFVTSLRKAGIPCRLVGSGCSSLIAYLLGISDVDPVRYRLPWQRFWTTADNEIPGFRLSVGRPDFAATRIPEHVHVQFMTPQEAAAWLPIPISGADGKCRDPKAFRLLWEAPDAIFGFKCKDARRIATNLRPQRLRDLATITALAQIEPAQPEVVDNFLRRVAARRHANPSQRKLLPRSPILFQEQVMAILRKKSGVLWGDAYRFVQTAARRNTDVVLRRNVIARVIRRGVPFAQAEQDTAQLESAARYSVCLAHHLANAISSYRAAYRYVHHRQHFEGYLSLLTVEGGKA